MRTVPLTPNLLVSAYANGVFPMDVGGRIEWFSPDPRAIIDLDTFHVPRTLRQTCRQGRFEIRVNGSFRKVMEHCGNRPDGTWISDEIVTAYCRLHELNLAHSVECWRGGELAGGLYGVALGGAFFGESMFSRQRDASKVALVHLVRRMKDRGFILLDVQFITPHLKRFGADEIPRAAYLRRLGEALDIGAPFVD